MKFLHINRTDKSGGAAISMYRLHLALREEGHESRILCGRKYSNDKDVFPIIPGKHGHRLGQVFGNLLNKLGLQSLGNPSALWVRNSSLIREWADVVVLKNLQWDVFFNELSIKTAGTDDEASEWLENLAQVVKKIEEIYKDLGNDSFRFRSKEDVRRQEITTDMTFLDFLHSKGKYGEPAYIYLLGKFDSPYITAGDPQKTEHELSSISMNGIDHDLTGIGAAYLKKSLVISLNCDDKWDICELNVCIKKLNEDNYLISREIIVKHVSKELHVINCHLTFLADLYDWRNYKPSFNPSTKTQNILPLIKIYRLYISDWDEFYSYISQLNTNDRVSIVKDIANKISILNRWGKATGSLKRNNLSRIIYTIPRSVFIVSVDTQHGEFEIHNNQLGDHLGSISFDGIRFKQKVYNRILKL